MLKAVCEQVVSLLLPGKKKIRNARELMNLRLHRPAGERLHADIKLRAGSV